MNILRVSVLLAVILFTGCNRNPENGPGTDDGRFLKASAWITAPAQGILFERQSTDPEFRSPYNSDPAIVVDTTVRYQEIDGFGNCLTGGSAILLNRMTPAARSALLQDLFSPEGNGIGISYLRISIGASDLSDRVFTYCDLPPGETDPLIE